MGLTAGKLLFGTRIQPDAETIPPEYLFQMEALTMDRDSVLNDLRGFIVEETNLEDEQLLQPDTDLFEAGLVDSLLAVSLVAFCEEKFGCELDLAELSQENFGSLNALTDLVMRSLDRKV